MADESAVAPAGGSEDPRYKAAKKRVEDIKGFYVHLLIYVCVNAGLFVINAVTSWGAWWFYWSMIGWGIGLVVHALTVFVFEGRWLGPDWERRRIDKILSADSAPPGPSGPGTGVPPDTGEGGPE
ncbi:MAG: 2TM domain-containing protein [Acidimicrobiia bacterium]